MKTRLFFYVRRCWITFCHIAMVAVSLMTAFLLRFDFAIPRMETPHWTWGLQVVVPLKLTVFFFGRLHRGWWRLVGMPDLIRVFSANTVASVLFAATAYLTWGQAFPRSIYLLDFLLCFVLTAGARFAVRLYSELVVGEFTRKDKRILIYGAGSAGLTLLREARTNPSIGQVVGFLDDDRQKRKLVLMGVPVLGRGRDIPFMLDRQKRRGQPIDEVIIAMPSATGHQMGEAVANCRAAHIPCRTIPGLGELLTGKVLSAQIRDISLEDLLGREPVQLDETGVRAAISGRVVMVTGAAGSIGSELCRQVARFGPGRLILFDQAESDLFKIDMELRSNFPKLDPVAELGDIRDRSRVDQAILQYRVDSIFHAAAYKHVPLMESHVVEAVKNNVVGTWNVAQSAYRNGVSSFLMISSDKAVNPTSIMGVTKRLAELIVASMPADSQTKFVSVRFGNVLGSNGSVVPIFKQQIAAGGPVTVTHPEIERYFMTIPEAVQLVLQASTMGRGSEIFVLDMGEPVKIAELARNLIRLCGLVPDKDIEIRFTSLRPGEKLYEELRFDGEDMLPTSHRKIRIFRSSKPSTAAIAEWMDKLYTLLERRDEGALVAHMCELVPEYANKQKFPVDKVSASKALKVAHA
ncbi:MAG: polysaccharide biosynthesis protein [Acidobacteriia bacterium]|nr:polysaccharide biosynthesis protein [Terriglobia bacterium]